MSEPSQARRRTFRHLALAFLLLMVAKLAFLIPVDMGWIEGESVLTLVRWVAFVLNMLLIVLVFFIVNVWPESNRYNRAGKILISAFLGMFVLGTIARRLGLSDWLESQGRIVTTTAYVLSSLVMMGLMLALVVVAVLELQERTSRDIHARLHGPDEPSEQVEAIAEASPTRPEPHTDASPSYSVRSP